MSITFTNGGGSGSKPSSLGTPEKTGPGKKVEDKKPDPRLRSLVKQKTFLDKKIEKLQGKVVKAFLRSVTAADPNDDPGELTQQIKPYLNKVQIKQILPGETQIVPGKTNPKGESLYRVTIRRGYVIDMNIIERIKREPGFEGLEWDNKGLLLYVWYKYEAPAQPAEAGEVAGPGEKS